MNFSNILFPHPVLGIGNSIKGGADLLRDPIIISNKTHYEVDVKCFHINNKLDELIGHGVAEYLLEATCSNTLYRKVARSNTRTLKLNIPRKYVKGKVKFSVMLVASKAISNYTNDRFHQDFNDFTFNLERGDILAFYKEFDFDADIKYLKLRAASSFMVVQEDPDAEIIRIDLVSNKIIVWMPPEQYKIFANPSISKDIRFASIFHASIVLNALMYALYNINEYRKTLWARTIEYRLTLDEFKTLSLDDNSDISKIAQKLLGDPFKRLLSEVSEINESLLNQDE
ncbi:MAG: hypothetical protein WCT23_04300 [Candidatus Neomarinimicrobiota bacterium]